MVKSTIDFQGNRLVESWSVYISLKQKIGLRKRACKSKEALSPKNLSPFIF